MNEADRIEVVQGSDNIFADLDLPKADEMLLKANLAAELRRLIAERALTQARAAALLGMAQPDLSKLLRGSLRGYSVERLMGFLTAFDQDVEVTVRPHSGPGRGGRITFTPVDA
ncbi:helix-turn-helix domain-containing protein [Methylobacterium platani]|uniref:XRE family transcriptional regulator n=2 Tax=Methylobacterium platani TaxID=427683 RepID=A0A179SBG8_9HYPH|nr:helix-turn-helix transcriptional regulator [Methylobacterium platani]KMO20298.1 XRE family transcriptional regulator [Methylobacterium platani JCM 14648]OAS24117.1 XRE family transcriptional regulator [Methylobacterium platani]